MVHPNVFSKEVVSANVQGVVVKAVDVGNQFKSKQEFESRDQMLQWIRTEASKLGFGVVTGRFDNGSDKRCVFVTMTRERSRKYRTPLRNFKRDDTGSRKCECPFKVHGYMLTNKNWRFNVICGLHNHDLCEKLIGHPSVRWLMPKEKECFADMTLNLVQPKNMLATLKRKRSRIISNIKQVHNILYLTSKVLMGDKTEMQQLLKLLYDYSYVSR
ncbi:uncharacterized protein LOC127103101 [Lathyrus oleraceus]|uniref:uncharacterized protein LOC127103101 n=1 Tax=Pisum sativum TaxID=3888 RepID=UPI0021D09071|nr:uncharacterized protein LOC127103101 [Pisum sativum]